MLARNVAFLWTLAATGSLSDIGSAAAAPPLSVPLPWNIVNNQTDGCSVHSSCSECDASSRFCHWCAHDHACHTVGSIYGCLEGVDCFANDQCQRPAPEPITSNAIYPRIKGWLLLVLGVIASLVVCVATCCLGLAASCKERYGDYSPLHAERSTAEELEISFEQGDSARQPLLSRGQDEEEQLDSSVAREEETDAFLENGPEDESPAVDGDEENSAVSPPAEEGEVTRTLSDLARDTYGPLTSGSRSALDPEQLEETPRARNTTASESSQPLQRRRSTAAILLHRIFTVCLGLYALTVGSVVLFLGMVLYDYPRVPQYNVCNDAVAWKSIFDNIASFQASVNVELLASVANPNVFPVALDMGQGSFTHNGAFVGTFDIPPVTVVPNAITDVMVIAHITPARSEALSLLTDFYRNQLVLEVSTVATVRAPAFGNLSYTAHLPKRVVHVSELSDRHLCHCQKWDVNHTMPFPSLDYN